MAHRMWLEVLKFLEPRELLLAELVCKDWREFSSSDEVWSEHLVEDPPALMRYKEVYHKQLQPTFLAHIGGVVLTIIDVRTLKERSVRMQAPFTPTQFGAWVSIPNRVLYCGGVSMGGRYVAASYLIQIASLQVQKLPDMYTARAGGGLVYYQGKVFVFGGDNDSRQGRSYGDLQACEKYSLQAKNWAHLPNMSSPRRSFTPFRHKEKIYIAGGGGADNHLEIFDIKAEQFTVSPYEIPFSNRLATCLIQGNQLALLSSSALTLHNLKTGVQEGRVALPPVSYWYSPGGTVTWKGKLYFAAYYASQLLAVDSTWQVCEITTN